MSQKGAFMPGASALPVGANEKMLSLLKRFGRYLSLIRRDTGVHACTPSSKIKDSTVPANEWLDSCEKLISVPGGNGGAW
jgi:hypothetical protein